MHWHPLSHPDPTELRATRLALHHAAQVASAAGTSLLTDQGDFVHTNLSWSPRHQALLGHTVLDGRQVGLRLADFSLLLLSKGSVTERLSLRGRTRTQALVWLEDLLATGPIALPDYELPPHPVAQGSVFESPPAAHLQELAHWYADAAGLLEGFAASHEGAGPVYCWPHHFDMATLVQVAEGKTVGVGFSPGDGSHDEPYLYLTPWPYPPDHEDLPSLEDGHWHTKDWFGAVLLSSEVVAIPHPHQAARLDRFLRVAYQGCREALTRSP